MAWNEPHNPVGSYDPKWMTNVYGASWSVAWNTAVYGDPTQAGADVLSNCVGWCIGRMLELYILNNPGYDPATLQTQPFAEFGRHNAGEWYDTAVGLGYETVTEPQAGCILVTRQHVAVIEKYEDGQWWISESGYYDPTPWYYQNSLYQSGGVWYSSYSSEPRDIIGFFKIPSVTPGPAPGGRTGYDRRRRYRNI